jgi:hypothetical protein
VPAETDVLCEGCGYTLNGLPETSNCPECGRPIAQSVDPSLRAPPVWERGSRDRFATFVRTTVQVLFRPTRFFRTMQTRSPTDASGWFALVHYSLASVLIGAAGAGHYAWFLKMGAPEEPLWVFAFFWVVGTMLALLCIACLTRLAAKLTTWEAAYRGFRLPPSTVLRGMHYHAAHYLPVAVGVCATVWGYRLLLKSGQLGLDSGAMYLYLLCGEVIVSAVYLFHTYWIAMRNMMYANR